MTIYGLSALPVAYRKWFDIFFLDSTCYLDNDSCRRICSVTVLLSYAVLPFSYVLRSWSLICSTAGLWSFVRDVCYCLSPKQIDHDIYNELAQTRRYDILEYLPTQNVSRLVSMPRNSEDGWLSAVEVFATCVPLLVVSSLVMIV